MWTLVKTASTPMLLNAKCLRRQAREDTKMRMEWKDKPVLVCICQGEPEHVPIVRLIDPRNKSCPQPRFRSGPSR